MKPADEYVRGYNNGVDAYNGEMDALRSEIEQLKAKVAELTDLAYLVDQRNEQGEGNVISYKDAFESASPTLTQIRSIGSNAIREAADNLCELPNKTHSVIIHNELYEYAGFLEAGTL